MSDREFRQGDTLPTGETLMGHTAEGIPLWGDPVPSPHEKAIELLQRWWDALPEESRSAKRDQFQERLQDDPVFKDTSLVLLQQQERIEHLERLLDAVRELLEELVRGKKVGP